VPAVRFGLKTTDTAGNVSPLSYEFESFLFGQDFTVTGDLLMDTDIYINKWGSYNITLQASNRSTVTMAGVTDESSLPDFDYDIGRSTCPATSIWMPWRSSPTVFRAIRTENPFARFSNGLGNLSLKATSVKT